MTFILLILFMDLEYLADKFERKQQLKRIFGKKLLNEKAMLRYSTFIPRI